MLREVFQVTQLHSQLRAMVATVELPQQEASANMVEVVEEALVPLQSHPKAADQCMVLAVVVEVVVLPPQM